MYVWAQDEFLVMASDGLFDVMGDQSVVDTVSKYLREHDNWCVCVCVCVCVCMHTHTSTLTVPA